MARSAKFLLVLVAGLAALTLVGYSLLTGMMRGWSEDDLALRSRLAVAAANDSFDGQWPDGRPRIKDALTRITRDERIMGAAACSAARRAAGRDRRLPHRVLLPVPARRGCARRRLARSRGR